MPDKENNILKYNSGEKHMGDPFNIYVDECLLEIISTCRDDPNESSTIKINEYTPSGYLLLAYCSFDNTKNRLSHYRGQGCMKMLCRELKEHAKKIIHCKKKEVISLTDEENESHENNNSNMNYKLSKDIPVVFHNGSTYDYHFKIKELAQEFERQFECLENILKNALLFLYKLIKKL